MICLDLFYIKWQLVKLLKHSMLNLSVVCVLFGSKIKAFKIFIEQLHYTDESQKGWNTRLQSISWPLHPFLSPWLCSKILLYSLLLKKVIYILKNKFKRKKCKSLLNNVLCLFYSYILLFIWWSKVYFILGNDFSAPSFIYTHSHTYTHPN